MAFGLPVHLYVKFKITHSNLFHSLVCAAYCALCFHLSIRFVIFHYIKDFCRQNKYQIFSVLPKTCDWLHYHSSNISNFPRMDFLPSIYWSTKATHTAWFNFLATEPPTEFPYTPNTPHCVRLSIPCKTSIHLHYTFPHTHTQANLLFSFKRSPNI